MVGAERENSSMPTTAGTTPGLTSRSPTAATRSCTTSVPSWAEGFRSGLRED